jgi:prepilin-type N-terminal cleavage/methylation domain-containing protein
VNRRGFSLVELLMVIVVLGIVINLALPAISTIRRKAEAAHVIGDFRAIRVAALDRYAADGAFPPIDAYGRVPPRMAAGLPQGFAFRYGQLEYRWISFTWDDDGKTRVFAGVSVRGGTNPKLMESIRAAYRGPILYISSTEFILMVE